MLWIISSGWRINLLHYAFLCVMCSHSHLAVCGGGSLHCMWMALSSCRGPWWVGGRLALGRGVFLFPLRPQQVPVELAWLDTEGLRDGKVCSTVSMQFCSYICSSTNSWAWIGGQTRGGFEWTGRDWCRGGGQGGNNQWCQIWFLQINTPKEICNVPAGLLLTHF